MTVKILVGDVLAMLATLADDSVDCVVTSPPYWGLRDYGVEGQIGLERTLGEHLAVMIAVFREVRRVLKPTGTLWLNYGDCYATTPNGRSAADTKAAGNDDRTFRDKPFSTVGAIYEEKGEGWSRGRAGKSGNLGNHEGRSPTLGRVVGSPGAVLKPKDLCMIPNRLAIALQEDGWWVRSEIIWGKTNPMPDSSGRYRPSTAHEKIFMLSKSGKCFYDAMAVRKKPDEGARPARWKTPDNWDTTKGEGGHGSILRSGREKGKVKDKQRGHSRRHDGFNDRWDQMTREEQMQDGRFLRNYEPAPAEVWAMATSPFSDAHFATFPPELVERCLLAGCPAGGLVLDPFGGAGTTGLVADRLGRDAILIELNPEYAEMARRRIHGDAPLFVNVQGA